MIRKTTRRVTRYSENFSPFLSHLLTAAALKYFLLFFIFFSYKGEKILRRCKETKKNELWLLINDDEEVSCDQCRTITIIRPPQISLSMCADHVTSHDFYFHMNNMILVQTHYVSLVCYVARDYKFHFFSCSLFRETSSAIKETSLFCCAIHSLTQFRWCSHICTFISTHKNLYIENSEVIKITDLINFFLNWEKTKYWIIGH